MRLPKSQKYSKKTKVFYTIDIFTSDKKTCLKIKHGKDVIRCFMRLLNNPRKDILSAVLKEHSVNWNQFKFDDKLVIRFDSD